MSITRRNSESGSESGSESNNELSGLPERPDDKVVNENAVNNNAFAPTQSSNKPDKLNTDDDDEIIERVSLSSSSSAEPELIRVNTNNPQPLPSNSASSNNNIDSSLISRVSTNKRPPPIPTTPVPALSNTLQRAPLNSNFTSPPPEFSVEVECRGKIQSLLSSGNLEQAKKMFDSEACKTKVLLVEDANGRTFLHYLLHTGTEHSFQLAKHIISSAKCTEEVLSAISVQDNEGTILHAALGMIIPDYIFDALLKSPHCSDSVLSAKNKNKNTVLHEIVLKDIKSNPNKLKHLRRLLQSKKFTQELLKSQNDETKKTAFHIVVEQTDFAAFDMLMRAPALGADALKVLNGDDQTCLYQAADTSKPPSESEMSAAEFIYKRTLMVKRILGFPGCTPEVLACRKAKDRNQLLKDNEVISGIDVLNQLGRLTPSRDIAYEIASYSLRTELAYLNIETLHLEPSVRNAIENFMTSMRAVKPEDITLSELRQMANYVRNTRAFMNQPEENYVRYTDEINKVSKIDRPWGKIFAQLGLVLLFAGLTAAAISLSLASFGIGTAFVAATFGIVIAKQVTIGTGLAIASAAAGLALTGTCTFFAAKNIRRGEIARCGENLQDRVNEVYLKPQRV